MGPGKLGGTRNKRSGIVGTNIPSGPEIVWRGNSDGEKEVPCTSGDSGTAPRVTLFTTTRQGNPNSGAEGLNQPIGTCDSAVRAELNVESL